MKVAVIGAGVSGLASLKCLKEESVQAIAYESKSTIGGLWHFDPHIEGPAYPTLSMNTSRQVSNFSDFPYTESDNYYPTREEVFDYLLSYAKKNTLEDSVELNVQVKSIRFTESNRWELTAHSQNGRIHERFDKVVVCTGRHLYPSVPIYPQDKPFRGDIIHSIKYTENAPFKDRRVLLVGSGASAADLAHQISKIARQVFVSVKEGRWIIPRFIKDKPIDHQLTRFSQWIPPKIQLYFFQRAILEELRKLGIEEGGKSIGLPMPAFNLNKIRLTLNTDFLLSVKKGNIGIKPGIRTLDGSHVEFEDGSREKIDILVSATGYKIDFPFLDYEPIVNQNGDLNLYKYVFSPKYPSLAFIGLVNVQGPFLPVYEMQARWMARVFSSNCDLPTGDEMQAQVTNRHERIANAKERPAIVQYFDYMQEISKQIGVQPQLWKHPSLLPHLWFKPINGMHYRIDGPHKWDSANSRLRNL